MILQSPTTPSAEEQERLAFIETQLPELETRIRDSNARVAELDLTIGIGLSLSIGAVLLLEYLDDTARSPAEVRTILNAPIVAAIGKTDGDGYANQLIAEREPRSPLAEANRRGYLKH